MDFLLKTTYYGVTALVTFAFGLFFLGSLFSDSGPTSTSTHKLIFLVSGLCGLALFGWSVQLGHFSGHFLAGAGLAVLGLVVFGLLTLVGIFTFTNVHFQ